MPFPVAGPPGPRRQARASGSWRLRLLAIAAGLPLSGGLQQGRSAAPLHQRLHGATADEPRETKPTRQVLHNWDGHGLEYSADLTVGGQAIRGILDTGSYELLVFSSRCTTCGDVDEYFDESRSKSFEGHHLKTVHSFGSGDTWSQLAYDSVTFGPNMEIPRQYFWEVVAAQLPILGDSSFQAIVGVGPPSTPRQDTMRQAEEPRRLQKAMESHPEANPPDSVVRATQDALALVEEQTILENLAVKQFSVCLIKMPENADGYFFWHDDAPKRYPDYFVQVPVSSETTWGVRLQAARLEGGAEPLGDQAWVGCSYNCVAIVDSGTSLLVVPTPVLERVVRQLNELDFDCTNMAALPNLVFELGGIRFSVPPEAYIGEVVGDIPPQYSNYMRKHNVTQFTQCQVLLMSMDVETSQGSLWILGMPFFREYYTTFTIGDDIWDRGSRSLSIARADNECQPAALETPRPELIQRQRRRVDLSRVRLPPWAEAAAARKWVDL